MINFPVPAGSLAVTVNDLTANGVSLAEDGDVLNISDATPPPPSTITGVTATGPATIPENSTAQFTAKVTGTGSFNPAVVWSCSDGEISQTGLFTAPAKVENVIVKATSVQDPTKVGQTTIAISNPGNTVTIAASGGDDTKALQAAMNSAAAAGKILELVTSGGKFQTGPLTWPGNNFKMLADPGVLITDVAGYGITQCMFNINVANAGSFTATGAFAQMPISFAQTTKEHNAGQDSEYRHCVEIGAQAAAGVTASNFTLTGLSISQAGGDGVYVRNLAGVTLSNVTVSKNFRNGFSITGKVSGLTVNNFVSSTNQRAGIDFEPNTTTDYLMSIVLNNCETDNNGGGGMSFGPYALDKTSQPVTITVNGFQSNNDTGYGIFFTNGNYGNTPGGLITVNNATITNSGFGGAYGRYVASGPQIVFNALTIINPCRNGVDPHYAMNSACGVELTGGQVGPCGGVNFNIKTIASSNGKMVNYFQTGNQGPTPQNTTFAAPAGSLSGATNKNAITKYP